MLQSILMKEQIQIPQSHYSYNEHRRQFWLQIFLPVILAVLAILVVAILLSISAFGGTGDPARWAAISTIWVLIPAMIFGFLFLVTLVGLVYLLARALKVLPGLSASAQYYANRITNRIQYFSDLATRPFIFLNSLGASLRTLIGLD
jgi:uncharacterized membrane protein